MTVLDDRAITRRPTRVPPTFTRDERRGPGPVRPPVRPLPHRSSGARVSAAPHGPRAVSTPVTLALAGLAALITLWLGVLAQFGSGHVAAPARLPDRLAVVVVQAGENLHQLAARVAPDAPAAEVVDRIRGLNRLESASVDAGQTLIAPVG